MDPIKINGAPPSVQRIANEEPVERESKAEASSGSSGEAVRFKKGGTGLHALFSKAEEEVESISSADVARLREVVASGEYEPDLQLVAQRLLAALSAGVDGDSAAGGKPGGGKGR